MKIVNKTIYREDKQCKHKRNVEESSRDLCRVGKGVTYVYVHMYIEYVSAS